MLHHVAITYLQLAGNSQAVILKTAYAPCRRITLAIVLLLQLASNGFIIQLAV